METPEALERQVHRIHELLERSRDDVTSNDHIPDPDNPTQLRQIDITIRRDGKHDSLLNAGLSRSRQNVKWIEELIGRRQSLLARTRSLRSRPPDSRSGPREKPPAMECYCGTCDSSAIKRLRAGVAR